MAVGGASSPMPQANAAWATPEAAKWLEHRRHLQSSVGGRPKKHEVKSAQRPDAGAEGRNEEALAAREALQRFRRPHVLHADVGELTLHLALLDLKLAWFETVRYFVSFHPSSVRLPTVQLPKETPRPTSPDATNTKYMASPALAPSPKQKSETVVYDWQESVRFDEHMQMLSDHLDSHFLLFLWCSKSSLLSESTVLLGYRPLPLREALCQMGYMGHLGPEHQRRVGAAESAFGCHCTAKPDPTTSPFRRFRYRVHVELE